MRRLTRFAAAAVIGALLTAPVATAQSQDGQNGHNSGLNNGYGDVGRDANPDTTRRARGEQNGRTSGLNNGHTTRDGPTGPVDENEGRGGPGKQNGLNSGLNNGYPRAGQAGR